MRRFLVLGLILAACTSDTSTSTTIEPIAAPPNPEGTATTSNPLGQTTTRPPRVAAHAGAFPDGTWFTVYVEGIPEEEVTGMSGVVIFESSDGPIPAGVSRVVLHPIEETTYDDGVLTVRAGGFGGWVIDFYPHVLDELGDRAVGTILGAFRGSTDQSMPGMDIFVPFRWALPSDQLPTHMQVVYETFAVRKGCDEAAVACSDTHGVQVLPLDKLATPGVPFQGTNVRVSSPQLRLPTDPSFVVDALFPGRSQPDVFRIGNEWVVWGGVKSGAGPNDGAALNFDTGEGRPIEGPPIGPGPVSRAVWTGEEMMIVTADNTYVGDPVTDTWREMGPGIPIDAGDPMVLIERDLYVWTDDGIFNLDEGMNLNQLPELRFGNADPFRGNLLDFGGNLIATGTTCNSRRTAIWTGSEWNELETVRFNDCSWANQTAVVDGELIMWSTRRDPTYIYNAGELTWDRLDPIPIGGTEAPPSPLVLDGRVFVPRYEENAMFDVETRTWVEVDPPGAAPAELVWTGTEILARADGGRDTWRWTPPE